MVYGLTDYVHAGKSLRDDTPSPLCTHPLAGEEVFRRAPCTKQRAQAVADVGVDGDQRSLFQDRWSISPVNRFVLGGVAGLRGSSPLEGNISAGVRMGSGHFFFF